MNKLLERFNLGHISENFDEAYEKALCQAGTPDWLSLDFIIRLNKETGILSEHLEDALRALDGVLKNPDLILFAKTLYNLLSAAELRSNAFSGLVFPTSPTGEADPSYDLIGLFPILAGASEGYHILKKRGVPTEVLRNTYKAIDGCVTISSEFNGKLALDRVYFSWCLFYIKGFILRIGRFEFELIPNFKKGYSVIVFENQLGEQKILMNGQKITEGGRIFGTAGCEKENCFEAQITETDEYYEGYAVNPQTELVENEKIRLQKSEWKKFISPEDAVLSLHIPGKEAFDKEICEKSYNDARKIFKKAFSEYDFKAITTGTWLLDKSLMKILKPESNIVAFRNKFTVFPIHSDGCDVFRFVFATPYSSIEEADLSSLPETTSLMRKIKEMYLRGEYIHECGGFFRF